MESALAADVVLAALAQAAYLTVLAIVLALRISSRIAVMEFKVNELWAASRDAEGDL